VLGVDACTGGVKQPADSKSRTLETARIAAAMRVGQILKGSFTPLNVILASSLHYVEADHGVIVENYRVVRLDKAHATHICSQIEDMVASFADLLAVIKDTEINQMKLVAEQLLLQGKKMAKKGTETGSRHRVDLSLQWVAEILREDIIATETI
jgi:hypothetical protein